MTLVHDAPLTVNDLLQWLTRRLAGGDITADDAVHGGGFEGGSLRWSDLSIETFRGERWINIG